MQVEFHRIILPTDFVKEYISNSVMSLVLCAGPLSFPTSAALAA